MHFLTLGTVQPLNLAPGSSPLSGLWRLRALNRGWGVTPGDKVIGLYCSVFPAFSTACFIVLCAHGATSSHCLSCLFVSHLVSTLSFGPSLRPLRFLLRGGFSLVGPALSLLPPSTLGQGAVSRRSLSALVVASSRLAKKPGVVRQPP